MISTASKTAAEKMNNKISNIPSKFLTFGKNGEGEPSFSGTRFSVFYLSRFIASLLFLLFASWTSNAYALSASCTTLSSLDTNSFSQIFAASSFNSDETVTVSYTDNGGDPKNSPIEATDRVFVQAANYSDPYDGTYYSSAKEAGPHFYTITSSQLTSTGLRLQISTGTYISTVAVRCTGTSSAPTLTSVSPSQGPASGGTTVTITGTNLTGATSVTIGGTAATGITVNSATSITATTPAHAAGAADVVVTTPGGTATLVGAFTYHAPTITLSPPTLTGGTVGTAYSQTMTASGGAAPYSFAITAGSLPTGLSLNTANGIISGTPAASGLFNFTVTATDANSFTVSSSYALQISALAPVAHDVSATVAANSTGNTITLDISGGAVTSVAVASGASHGTATAADTSITYTPVSGYSGLDSFTYTATNANGTSPSATVTITVSAPTITLSPASGTLPAATFGSAYSQSLSASGGMAPYLYSVTSGSLPAGLTLSGDTITGTPTTSGTFSFTVTATDANGVTVSGAYVFNVAAVPVTLTLSPAAGTLKDAMVGEDYSQTISASGGNGTLVYSLTSGVLPDGLSLNPATGELTGPVTANAEAKDYNFTIQVADQNNGIGTATYTLTVKPRSVTATDTTIEVAAGATPNNVDLTRGATGGPFVSADIVSVSPANAGTISIVRGEFAQSSTPTTLGWYLKFTPNPAYSGRVQVNFSLTSALGISNTGTVTYNINYDPAEVANEIDALVHDFVRSRQSMISSAIKVPGLLERRRMAQASDPVTANMTPSENGMTVNFSTSLAQMESARDRSDGVGGGYASPFNIWIDGAFLAHNDKDINGSKWGRFAMINMGADYLVSERALVGLSFHYDYMTDPTDTDAELTGNGWLAGPYTSFEIGKGVFWNASLRYGGSSNTIDTQFWDGDFDTTRWMADTSIEGQLDLGNDMSLTPKLRAVYFSENVDDYIVRNEAGDALTIEGFNEEQFRVSLGAEIARSFTFDDGAKLTPKIGLTGGYSGLDGSGAFGSVSIGAAWQTDDAWSVEGRLLFNIEGDGERSAGAKAGISRRF